MERATHGEAEGPIDADGLVVGGEDVEDWRFFAGTNFAHDDGDERAGIAAATGLGMGANAADLNEARQVEPLTGHGEELAVIKDAKEGAELEGALTEGTGVGELGEFEHLGHVCRGESADEGFGGGGRGRRTICDHLTHLVGAIENPACGGRAGGQREGFFEE